MSSRLMCSVVVAVEKKMYKIDFTPLRLFFVWLRCSIESCLSAFVVCLPRFAFYDRREGAWKSCFCVSSKDIRKDCCGEFTQMVRTVGTDKHKRECSLEHLHAENSSCDVERHRLRVCGRNCAFRENTRRRASQRFIFFHA